MTKTANSLNIQCPKCKHVSVHTIKHNKSDKARKVVTNQPDIAGKSTLKRCGSNSKQKKSGKAGKAVTNPPDIKGIFTDGSKSGASQCPTKKFCSDAKVLTPRIKKRWPDVPRYRCLPTVMRLSLDRTLLTPGTEEIRYRCLPTVMRLSLDRQPLTPGTEQRWHYASYVTRDVKK